MKLNVVAVPAPSGRDPTPCQVSLALSWIVSCQRAFFHLAVLPGELEGGSSAHGKAMNCSFALFGIVNTTHCSHSALPYPATILPAAGTYYPEIQALVSYKNPTTTVRWQLISAGAALQAPVGLRTRTCEAVLLSITHPPSQPPPCFVLDKYDREAEELLFPDAFH